jgi:hypothetical protein
MALIEPELTPGSPAAPFIAFSTDGIAVRSSRGRVLRQSASGPVFRYAATCFDPASGATARRVLIARTLRRSHGHVAFGAMKQLWAGGFGKDSGDFYTMPEPVAHLPSLNLLVEGRPGGKPLTLYLDDPGSAQMLARLSARWLSKLHRTPLFGLPLWDVEADVDRLGGEAGALAEHCPELDERFGALARRLAIGILAIGLDAAVPTHGSFRPESIHVGRDRVSVGDFGAVAMGHRARDLAQFVAASLAASYGRSQSFLPVDTWNCAFIQEYVGLEGPDSLPALPLLIARELLGHLRLRLTHGTEVPALAAEAFLEECSRWLDLANIAR